MVKEKIKAYLAQNKVLSNSVEARQLNSKSDFGKISDDNEKVLYSPCEAIYLEKNNKMDILDLKGRKIGEESLLRKIKRIDKKIRIKYPVYEDLRNRGYIVKGALKFGADFRVYPKEKKSKESHAKWVVFVDYSTNKFSWTEFSAKNRVAHSTKKNLLLAIVDEEEDVLYYEIKWIKP